MKNYIIFFALLFAFCSADDSFRTLTGHSDQVWSLAVLPNGTLASGSRDSTIKIWNTETGQVIRTLTGHSGPIHALAVLPDGVLASGSANSTIKLWNISTGQVIRTLTGHSGPIHALAVLPYGVLASGSANSTIKLWNISTGAQVDSLTGHSGPIHALAVLPDGVLASGSTDHVVRLWDVLGGYSIRALIGHSNAVYALVSLNRGLLVSGSADHTIKIWSSYTGNAIRTISAISSTIYSLFWLHDDIIASGATNSSIQLLNVNTGEIIGTFSKHKDSVFALSALNDGSLVSGSEDGTIKLWLTCTTVGYYCASKSWEPLECPTGSFCPAGTISPVLCSQGTFNQNYGQSEEHSCLPCKYGEYCPDGAPNPSQAQFFSSAITASSFFRDRNDHGPLCANFDTPTFCFSGGWQGNASAGQWIQLDTQQVKHVTGAKISHRFGGSGGHRWNSQRVTKVRVLYSIDQDNWIAYDDYFSSSGSFDLFLSFNAQYVRFIPLQWNSAITMRVEVYASDQVIQQAVHSIPQFAISTVTVSSFNNNQNHGPECANFITPNDCWSGGWQSGITSVGQWIQLDMQQVKHVTSAKISHRFGGNGGHNWDDEKVLKVRLLYSGDGSDWIGYGDYFSDSGDYQIIVSFNARYVRFVPLQWKIGRMTMRVEVYANDQVIQQAIHSTPQFSVSTITASSFQQSINKHRPACANFITPNDCSGAWVAHCHPNFPCQYTKEWVQLDMHQVKHVTGIKIGHRFGGFDGHEWDYQSVTKVRVLYSIDQDNWIAYDDYFSSSGSFDLFVSFNAQYVRLVPFEWVSERIAMRVEVYASDQVIQQAIHSTPQFAISTVTTSSVFYDRSDHGTHCANFITPNDCWSGGWQSGISSVGQWIRFDMQQTKYVTAMKIGHRFGGSGGHKWDQQCVKRLQISYSSDNIQWVLHGEYFNEDGDHEITASFDARYVRFIALEWSTLSMRVEVYAISRCSIGFYFKNNDCITCPQGNYCPNDTFGIIVCPDGYYCPIGSHSPIDCPEGYYCPIGSHTPIDCSNGYECPVISASPCEDGKYLSDNGDCNECPPGKYCVQTISTPVLCPPGFYCPPGSFAPTACLSGFYCLAGSSDPIDCPDETSCPAGSGSPCNNGEFFLSDKCHVCPGARYCVQISTFPILCPIGSYCSAGSAFPLKCPPGNYCPAESANPTQCPEGTFSNRTKLVDLSQCSHCLPGKFCPIGSVTPTECPSGYYCPINSVGAMQCPEGRYNPLPGKTDLSACQECPSGSYCPSKSSFPILCPEGTFNQNGGSGKDTDCLQCPENTHCPLGSSIPLSLPGYWLTEENEIVGCSPRFACIGGNECSEGYTNARCKQCARNYFRNENGICKKCPTVSIAFVALLLGGLIFLVAIVFAFKKYNIKIIAFMVLLGFAQILSTFKLFNLNWPNPINFSMNFMSFFNIDVNIVNPGCIENLNWGIKTQFTLLHTIALVTILSLCCTYKNASLYGVCIIFLRILHIPLIKSALNFLDCDPKTGVLEADPSIECGSDAHIPLIIFGVLSIIFLGVGLIIIFITILLANFTELSKESRDSEMVKRYGKIFEGCKPKFFYWRVIVMIRQFMLTFLSIMISTKPILQAILAILTLLFFLMLQLYVKPFTEPPKPQGVEEKIKGKIKDSHHSADGKSGMLSDILKYAHVFFQDTLNENITQIEELVTQIIVLCSGIGFNTSTTESVVYNVFGFLIAALILIVFVHFIRMFLKEIRQSKTAPGSANVQPNP